MQREAEPDAEPSSVHKPRRQPSLSYLLEQSDAEPLYGHPLMCASLPTETFPRRPVPARVAHQLIKDELALDGNPKMNVRDMANTAQRSYHLHSN
ncbi:hypothetical protein PINS_up002866 [Pythium insidiosum]|nr:hypothetical protein PINS_up002866 [Pythium insidiosum]